MNRIYFVNINSFGGTPLMKPIVSFLKSFFDISLVETHINGTYSYRELARTSYISSFKDARSFNNQGGIYKLYKYVFVAFYLLKISFNKELKIIYSNDYQVIAICCWLKTKLRRFNFPIVYHQFELIEFDKLTGLNQKFINAVKRYSKEIDLVVVPEINRLEYLQNILKLPDSKMMLFPNTNNGEIIDKGEFHPLIADLHEQAKLIGHIRSVGPNHFIESFLKVFSQLDDENVYFLMVGKMDDSLQDLINKYHTNRFIVIPELPHRELNSIYNRLDLGVILYKGIDLNFEYCAPNKLYEYWANGIPVLANKLKGLEGVFDNDIMGELIDFRDKSEIEISISKLIANQNKNDIREYFQEKYNVNNYLTELKEKLKLIVHA